MLDIQSMYRAAGVPAESAGVMRPKNTGLKHGLAVDVWRMVIVVAVLAVSVHDNAAGIAAGHGTSCFHT
ncbi:MULTISPECIES: hypothetical protein [Streptomyces]|uniref:hypothetical protein n=1 Tax=Streptomyces TaxID=1883 RepID=UPI00207A93DE|nr:MULTISPECIES: hypothetical protein [Streptomyces]MCM9078006.1 hypothetical protein [Streptomyces spororaveus]MCX4803218.1 hypothetical protein [Streptomyces sp. NBC_01214]WSC76182.1 hypothetical protein OHA56_07535 [Streptomyces virginiae]